MAHRVVLDTNVLVAAAYAPGSAARRIVEACLQGRLVAVASPAVRREYDFILARAVRVEDYQDRLAQWLEGLEMVEPGATPQVVPDDPEDDKLVAAAVAGEARWLITNDRHLLDLGRYGGVEMIPTGRFVDQVPFLA
jgi:putative PIN family toxin of toxin-antitoxin system